MKKMNKTEIFTLVTEKNNGIFPKIGGGMFEKIGRDIYGFKIVDITPDNMVIIANPIQGNGKCEKSFIIYAKLVTNPKKKTYGKYVKAIKKQNKYKIISDKTNTYFCLCDKPVKSYFDSFF